MTILARLKPEKFKNATTTADGANRAFVSLKALETLWVNTGTLCNLTCRNCYIESSPKNDRLAYMTTAEVLTYLDEIQGRSLGTTEIGFTGGEPFMNPDFTDMLAKTLARGFHSIVLTNAMKPMMKCATELEAIGQEYANLLTMRISLDHHTKEGHEAERGPRSWQPALDGLSWLNDRGFRLNVAGRTFIEETEDIARAGYDALFSRLGLKIDAYNPTELVLFPEMDATLDVPEITTACWGILDIDPNSVMCATSRMIVKRKSAKQPAVLACTLLPYDRAFELGPTLQEAEKDIFLNHPHCARFCVLGGASCSQG